MIDYKLVDVHFDDKVEMFDGGAIATPDVFIQIQKSLKLDYPVEFAIIRGYGIGIKGMITNFYIIGYLNDVYEKDTEYFRKSDGNYQFKDMWNEWQTVTENTMLLNESMVNLAKYYDADQGENMSTYKQRVNEVDPKYKDIIGKLYVTNVNKRDEDIEDYRRTNYQLINALALSKADYVELNNSQWEFVDIYADEGISGTTDKKRPQFKQMIENAKAGKIDMILTKSISRFSRNTVVLLENVRELKDRGIAVIFEKENINTLEATGEVLLTILSSIAQDERVATYRKIHAGELLKVFGMEKYIVTRHDF
ncbi:recombinase family protein [Rummeliibacillus suwonensis]|uniref:recombinase family protein n=1 Tax=Rummeliibacillus suwonensis TaxID=1306154 RepID=UPI001FBAF701|nr:recombinase family protein [Rummeliibacillus suwonensis]